MRQQLKIYHQSQCLCKCTRAGHSISWLETSTNCDVKITEMKPEELTGSFYIVLQ